MFQRYRLAEISKIKSGKRLPAGCDFSTEVTAHPYIRARDIKNGKLLSDDLAYISDETHRKIQRYIISEGDVAITIVANIGDVGFCDKRLSGANLTENAVRLTDFTNAADGRYLSYYLSQPFMKQYIALFANGANVLHLRPQCVLKVKVQLPADEEIARYARFARPLVAEINSCNSQNALLARQRDLLLPRLMSGKLSMEGVG